MITLKQLHYFVTIVDCRSIRSAAAKLFIAQPALSRQLQILEQSTGLQLVIRNAKGIVPTPDGHIFYGRAQSILRQLNSLSNIRTTGSNAYSGPVSIGMPSSAAKILSIPLLSSVRQQLPGVEFGIIDIPSADLEANLKNGKIDIALIPDQPSVQDLFIKPFIREELLFLAPKTATLPPHSVMISETTNRPFVLPRAPNKLRMRVDFAFLTSGHRYKLIAEASTSAIMLPLVRRGLAVTVLPYSAAVDDIRLRRINHRRLSPPMYRYVSLCLKNDSAQDELLNAVSKLIVNISTELIRTKYWKYCKSIA